ncbi:ankyrin repeat-containing protein At5g02620-like [Spinacia oleracea]|uniref:Ankyrin repeat-containing protein At5g02620-like n=1 Tax=Spinacia oleracea TaxID=3562 RepID=A0A9R0K556_SPIOL|nr:ankyrin repeat-containing protein At5g02620-like [Spinacia oleracea]
MEDDITMSLELYAAAVNGDMSIFPNQGSGEEATSGTSRSNQVDIYFLTVTLEERNTILHVAARTGHNLSFIAEALKRFPILISQTNSKGETALHVSARQGNKEITKLLVTFYRDAEAAAAGQNGSMPLWRVKNSEGDTPLHTAIKRGKIQVALFLISVDNSLAISVNNSRETPLHLAAKICSRIGGNLVFF